MPDESLAERACYEVDSSILIAVTSTEKVLWRAGCPCWLFANYDLISHGKRGPGAAPKDPFPHSKPDFRN